MHENRETSETPAVQTDSRSAGEGKSRTARVYVYEESHCGIVPMNHSNKDGTSSAESEEGRLRIEENTLPSSTYPTQSGIARVSWVGECADKRYVGRYLSEIRTGCANERPSGSVRGAIRGVSTLLCKRPGFVFGDGCAREGGNFPFPRSAMVEKVC